MLDEGAGGYDGPALAAAFESLGTSLHVEVDADAAYFSFTVLKENLAPAVALLADVIQRPRFAEKDFARAHGLWVDALRARADDADAVARVVMRKVVMGTSEAAHPWAGTVAGASRVNLASVREHYRQLYDPSRAHFAVSGDVASAELTRVLEVSFAKWKGSGGLRERGEGRGHVQPLAEVSVITSGQAAQLMRTWGEGSEGSGGRLRRRPGDGVGQAPLPRLVVVDRPGAPQAVVGFARVGLSATDANLPGVMRANIALGGSFTSRLNQDLREKHGWTYGARSAFSVSSAPGLMVAWAAVQTDATIDASKALLADVREFAGKGLTGDEVSKTRATMNAEFVRSYSAIDAMAARLAQHAIFGKPLDADAQLLKVATSLDGPALNALAGKHFATDEGTFVIVGPLERFRARLSELGLGDPQLRDAEGQVMKRP
jgi:predicted Zn-dependent peptidase